MSPLTSNYWLCSELIAPDSQTLGSLARCEKVSQSVSEIRAQLQFDTLCLGNAHFRTPVSYFPLDLMLESSNILPRSHDIPICFLSSYRFPSLSTDLGNPPRPFSYLLYPLERYCEACAVNSSAKANIRECVNRDDIC